MGCAHRAHRRRGTLRALHRPAVHPRGDVARGFRRTRTARHRRGASGADHGDGRPQHPHRRPAPPHRRASVAASGRDAARQLRPLRHRALRHGRSAAGDRTHHRPRTGAHAAGHDDRLRRQPHLHARRAGGRRLRRGNLRSRNGTGQPVHPARQAARDAHHRRRHAALGHGGQGHYSPHHRAHHRFGRNRPFHRIRRRGDPLALDGGTHDGMQHEYRVRRPRRHDRPRPDDLRLPARTRTRGGGNFTATPTHISTANTGSTPPRSRR